MNNRLVAVAVTAFNMGVACPGTTLPLPSACVKAGQQNTAPGKPATAQQASPGEQTPECKAALEQQRRAYTNATSYKATTPNSGSGF